MDTIEMNRRAGELLKKWDPFDIGERYYDAEVADVLTALQSMDHPTDLAKCIQRVYEFSFKQWIPIEKCIDVSYKLLAVKFELKCII